MSKTITNTIAVSGSSAISYLRIANDDTYMYITDTGATKKVHMLNLATLVASTIITTPSQPSTPLTAVPDPSNTYLYIVGSDASAQVAGYDIQKISICGHSVGQASQSGKHHNGRTWGPNGPNK